MWRLFRQWPALAAGLLCLAVGVELARRDQDYGSPRAVLYAIGSLLIGFAIGKGTDDG